MKALSDLIEVFVGGWSEGVMMIIIGTVICSGSFFFGFLLYKLLIEPILETIGCVENSYGIPKMKNIPPPPPSVKS